MSKKEFKYFIGHQSKEWNPLKEKSIRNNTIALFPIEAPYKYIEALVKELKPQVLVIDSLSEILVDLRDEKEARVCMKFLDRLRREYNVAILIIHHQRKASGENKKPTSLSDLYGSYIIGKVPETVLCLWQTKEDDPTRFELFSLKGRFNNKQTLKLTRNENLVYTTEEFTVNVSNSGNPLLGEGIFNINKQ